MNLVRIIIFLVVIISYSSCRKKVTNYQSDLVGVWTATFNDKDYTVTIVEDGKSTYYEDWDTAYVETTGIAKIAVKKNENDILVIGKKDLTIDEDEGIDSDIKYPTDVIGVDPHYQLVLDGILYRKEK